MNYPKGIIKPILMIILIVTLVIPVFSATWQRTYGGSGTECGNCVIQDSEGYFIIAGNTSSFGAGGRDIWVLKVNSLGDTVWTRTFGGSNNESVFDIYNTSDSCYLVTSNSGSYGIGCILIIKVNNNGDSVFAKIIKEPYQIILTSSDICPDDGLVLAGGIYYPDSSNGYLVKLDVEGDIVFTREYSEYPFLTSVGSNDDGSFIMTPDKSQGILTRLIKLDSMGNEIWSVCYDSLIPFLCMDPLRMAHQTLDGGFYFVVYLDDEMCTAWDTICLTDSNGNLINKNLRISNKWSSEIHLLDVKEIENIGFLICSYHWSSGGQASTYGIYGIFEQIFFQDFGSPSDTFGKLYSGYPCLDNGYIFTGYISYSGNSELVIIKTDSTGSEGVQEYPPIVINNHQISVHWLNSQNYFNISIPIESDFKFKIYDLQGRLVESPLSRTLSPGTHQISFRSERSGIYFYRLESPYGTETGKFMVVR